MSSSLVHRGPDDANEWVDGRVALAYRRLAILDLDHGRQPMQFRNGSSRIVYNGEVYNHELLRKQLPFDASAYRTRCDTETVIAAYSEMGADCLSCFNGMFAFAVHDRKDDSLFLARDRLGIKPLYYYCDEELFAFASEIKALLAHPEIAARIDHSQIPVYLALKYALDEKTLFDGVKRLAPGHYLKISKESLEIQEYWDLPFGPKHVFESETEAVEEFRSLLVRSVQSRLMSDAPLGAFLSGGIDSAYVTTLLSELTSEPVQTYSIGFREDGYDEFRFSRRVAARTRARVHEVVLTADQWFASWPLMVYHEDEPIAHPSSISLHHLSELASRDVKVVLSGEGADELLAGYERYYQTMANMSLARVLPESFKPLSRAVIDALPAGRWVREKLTRTSFYLPAGIESLYLDNYAAFSRQSLRQTLLNSESLESLDRIYKPFSRLMQSSGAEDLLDRILYADIKTYLAELLMKQDQMSMSASLEARVPFLDHELVEFVCRLPRTLKLGSFQTKRILRKAAAGRLPKRVIRRRKMGFPTPIRGWFRGSHHAQLESLLLSPQSLCGEIIDRPYVESLLDLHASGAHNLEDRIWALGNLELWLRIFIDGQNPHDISLVGAPKVR